QGREVSTTTALIQYGGKPAQLVTIHAEPPQNDEDKKFVRYEERIRIDAGTGLPQLKEIDEWDVTGQSIRRHYIVAYDYPDTLPDEIFAFTPPAPISPLFLQETVASLVDKVNTNG